MTQGVWASVERRPAGATFHLPPGTPAGALVHPFMFNVCGVHAHWRGGLAVHAGAVVLDGRAWGVFGDKGAGKSTTLAALAQAGLPVLSDDQLVYEAGQAFAGPRFIDLRAGSAERFPGAVDVGRMGLRVRWRLPLGPAPWSAPLAGWFVLDWGDAVAATTVPVAHRLAQLSDALTVYAAPRDPRILLDAAALPMVRIQRPRTLDRLGELTRLIEDVGRSSAG